jgi:hypothetical protein
MKKHVLLIFFLLGVLPKAYPIEGDEGYQDASSQQPLAKVVDQIQGDHEEAPATAVDALQGSPRVMPPPFVGNVVEIIDTYRSHFQPGKLPDRNASFTLSVGDRCAIDALAPQVLNLSFTEEQNSLLRQQFAYVLSKVESLDERERFLTLCSSATILNGGPFYVPSGVGSAIAKKVWYGYASTYEYETFKIHFLYTLTLLTPANRKFVLDHINTFLLPDWYKKWQGVIHSDSYSYEPEFEPSGILLGLDALRQLYPDISSNQIMNLGRHYQIMTQGKILKTLKTTEVILRLFPISEDERDEFASLLAPFNLSITLEPVHKIRASRAFWDEVQGSSRDVFELFQTIPFSERKELASLVEELLFPEKGRLQTLWERLRASAPTRENIDITRAVFFLLAKIPKEERSSFVKALNLLFSMETSGQSMIRESHQYYCLKELRAMSADQRQPFATACHLYFTQVAKGGQEFVPPEYGTGMTMIVMSIMCDFRRASVDKLNAFIDIMKKRPLTYAEFTRLKNVDVLSWGDST